MVGVTASARIRYCDQLGRHWSGQLSTSDDREGRRFSFDLECEESSVPHDTGRVVADEIEGSGWLNLQAEGGRHLKLRDPLITYVPVMTGWDQHGPLPLQLRGLGHDLAESRFAFDHDKIQVSSVSFSSNSALFIIAERLLQFDPEGRVTPLPTQKLRRSVPGLGVLELSFGIRVIKKPQQVSMDGFCRVTVVSETPVVLSDAISTVRAVALFLDFLFGKPMSIPKAMLRTAQGTITLFMGGASSSSTGNESCSDAAVQVSSIKGENPASIDWDVFFKAIDRFWANRDRLMQPMNVALIALHSSFDLLYRFFVTIPTLDQFLPRLDMTAEDVKIMAMKEAFFQHIEADAQAKAFCGRFMQLSKKAKPPTFAMTLDPAIARICAEGWHVPESASKRIKALRDRMAHSARLDTIEGDNLWPLLAAATTILIGRVFQELEVPLAAVHTDLGSNYRAIGQLPKD